jgi:L-ribulose-5-phosphate 4-epimerase
MGKYSRLKEECYEANMQLPALGLVLFTFGNASAVDRDEGIFAIKPSGVPYGDLHPDHMVVVDFENHIIEGAMRPSSDTKTHSVLYKSWDFIGSVVHTHSTYATAWAQTQQPIPIFGTTHADHLSSDIPCAPVMDDKMIEGDYEHQTGYQIVKAFTDQKIDPREIEMILVANHAPFTWGKDAQKAVYNSAVLEELAKMAFISLTIKPDTPRMKEALIKKHFERKHGKNAYYGQ